MDAWIIRLPEHPPIGFGGSRPVVVLHVSGEGEEMELEVLRIGSGHPSLGVLVQNEIEKRHSRLILDLCGLEKIDSTGIAEIAAGFVHAKDSGGELVVANLRPEIRKILQATNFETVIPTFDSVRAAARHFET